MEWQSGTAQGTHSLIDLAYVLVLFGYALLEWRMGHSPEGKPKSLIDLITKGPNMTDSTTSPAPAAPVGTVELTQAVDGLIDVVQTILVVKKDGALGLLKQAPMLAVSLPLALAGVEKIPAEVKDLSVDEAVALGAHVVDRLDVTNVKARLIVEKALRAAVALNDLRLAIES